jgi:hypothetical protein
MTIYVGMKFAHKSEREDFKYSIDNIDGEQIKISYINHNGNKQYTHYNINQVLDYFKTNSWIPEKLIYEIF